ncbi:hypothetical protein EUTSA_v10019372mg [Eutrema salsugineum]|uniref:Uncharacterized protein n=1 Tax=Eutrema salsugineum TaxID=72664 RepID=V4KDG6_EUTSA|nr:hypothetical protein EUTSA_v10019372mg [Eutrema salsugineum]
MKIRGYKIIDLLGQLYRCQNVLRRLQCYIKYSSSIRTLFFFSSLFLSTSKLRKINQEVAKSTKNSFPPCVSRSITQRFRRNCFCFSFFVVSESRNS